MIKSLWIVVGVLMSICVYAGNSDRAGEAGAYELLINAHARTMGMMGINSANVKGTDAFGTNIAGLAHNKKISVFGNYLSWLQGTETTMIGIGVANEISPGNNLGLNVNFMTFGKILNTTTESPLGVGYFSPFMLNIGLSYARVFGRGVRAGITGRLINEGINNLSATGFSVDAGLQYTTGTKEDLHFGVFIRNLGFPMTFQGDGLIMKAPTPGGVDLPFYQRAAKFELPAQFSIGLTKDLFFGKQPDPAIFCKPIHRLSISGNFVYNAFLPNNYGLGFEYAFREALAFRAGFLYEDDALDKEKTRRAHLGLAGGISYDLKLGKGSKNPPVLEVAYNYRPTWVFNGTHNLSFTFFAGKHSYCDELKIEKKAEEVVEKPKEKKVEPEIKYITKYDTIIKQAPPKIETVTEYKQVNDMLKNFAGNIEFRTATAILTDRGEGALMVIGELMRQYPNSKFKIAGHTDGDGDEDKNMRLSKLRAKTVARYLNEFKGIPDNAMVVEWYGESKPIADNTTEDGKQRNRRVEITVIDSKLESMSNSKSTTTTTTVATPEVKKEPKVEEVAKKTPQEDLSEIVSNMAFKTGTDTLTKISKRNIAKIAAVLKENPNIKVKFETHTDNQSYSISNKDLSDNRAKAIIELLKAEGVDAARMSYEGYGDTKPIDNNESETGRSKNRRIEVKVIN